MDGPEFPLTSEIAPTLTSHLHQIQPWVISNLKSTMQSDVHYENQLYGALNTLLLSIFPVSRRFMIIPQGLLRKVVEPDSDEDVDMGNISIGSTGGLHESRNCPGSEDGKLFPDFVVVKVIPQPANQPRQYSIVEIVEVKRNEEPESKSFRQVKKYLRAAYSLPSHNQKLCAHLVMGESVRRARMNTKNDVIIEEVAGGKFVSQLCQIAIRNWN